MNAIRCAVHTAVAMPARGATEGVGRLSSRILSLSVGNLIPVTVAPISLPYAVAPLHQKGRSIAAELNSPDGVGCAGTRRVLFAGGLDSRMARIAHRRRWVCTTRALVYPLGARQVPNRLGAGA